MLVTRIMETPDFSHLYSLSYCKEFSSVYEPSQDSFLFLDALEKEMEIIINSKPTLSLEIGSGSGIISSFLSKNLKERNSNIFCICTDINPKACKSTRIMTTDDLGNSKPHYNPVDTMNCYLANPFLSRLQGNIDIIMFNPPYVPTSSEEMNDIEAAAWAGGINGTEVTFKFLKQVIGLLSPKGSLYLLILKENNLEEIIDFVQNNNTNENNPLKCCTVLARKCQNEFLSIIKFYY